MIEFHILAHCCPLKSLQFGLLRDRQFALRHGPHHKIVVLDRRRLKIASGADLANFFSLGILPLKLNVFLLFDLKPLLFPHG